MIYFYHCYRGAHLSCVAAALHLKRIQPSAGVKEILSLEYFDVLQNRDMGVPVLAGYSQGNPVCFVGLGSGSKIFARFADSLTTKMQVPLQYKSVDCLECINLLTRIGGFISRFKGLKQIGRYLAARGVHKNLDKIFALVLQARGS
ncbi:MAG TPA: hypothetical protein DDY38_05160 [Firmicutes bacterium]|jgi:hypothetical protein|nr:hypothetical protein [Bacillota bacterium]